MLRSPRGRYRAAVVLAVLVTAGGAAYAYAGSRAATEPADVVRAYFAALARGDAAGALGYGTVPPGPRAYLTDRVLAEQLRVAPIEDVRVGPVRGSNVAVALRLGFAGGSVPVRSRIGVQRDGSGWRLRQVAVAVAVRLDRARQRATLAGTSLPSRAVLLFPGALPLRFDSPGLQVTGAPDDVWLGPPVLRTVGVGLSPAATRSYRAALAAALRACLAPGAQPDCPLPASGRYEPGRLRGQAIDPFRVRIGLDANPDGLVRFDGTVDFRGTYRRLDFANVAQTHQGRLTLAVHAWSWASGRPMINFGRRP